MSDAARLGVCLAVACSTRPMSLMTERPCTPSLKGFTIKVESKEGHSSDNLLPRN